MCGSPQALHPRAAHTGAPAAVARPRRYRAGTCAGTADGYRCVSQPKCGKDQYLSGATGTAAGVCKDCATCTAAQTRVGSCGGTEDGYTCVTVTVTLPTTPSVAATSTPAATTTTTAGAAPPTDATLGTRATVAGEPAEQPATGEETKAKDDSSPDTLSPGSAPVPVVAPTGNQTASALPPQNATSGSNVSAANASVATEAKNEAELELQEAEDALQAVRACLCARLFPCARPCLPAAAPVHAA